MSPGASRRALLLTFLLVAQVVALGAGADHPPAPASQAPDLRVVSITVDGVVRNPGSAPTALDTDDIKRYFVSSGQQVKTTLTIANDGTASASEFYIELRPLAANGVPEGLMACPRIDGPVPAQSASFTYSLTWTVPDVPGGSDAKKFMFRVNAKDSGGGCAQTGKHLPELAVPPGAGGALTQTTAWEDNFGNVTLAVNRKPDLRVKVGLNPTTPFAANHSRTIAWCNGAQPTDPLVATLCFGSGVVGVDKANVTAYARDATHFAVEVINGAQENRPKSYWDQVYQANLTNMTLPGRQRVEGKCDLGTWNACRVYVQFRALETASPASDRNLDFHLDTNVTRWSGLDRITLNPESRPVASCGAFLPGGTTCKNFDLDRKAGNYTLTVRLDPNLRYPDLTAGETGVPENRTFTRAFHVRHAELGGNSSYHRLQQAMGAAWQVDSEGVPILPTTGTLKVDVYVRNHGGPAAIAADRPGLPIRVRAFLLNPTSGESSREIFPSPNPAINSLQPGQQQGLTFDYQYVAPDPETNPGNALRGGKVILRVVIDRNGLTDTTPGDYQEQCEDTDADTVGCDRWKNVIDIPFKIRDTIRPTIVAWGKSTGACTATDGSDCTIDPLTTAPDIRKKAPLQFTVVMTDDDESLHTATNVARLNLTVNGQRVPQQENFFPAPGVKRADGKVAFTLKFPNGLETPGTYQVQIDVKDSFGNRPSAAEPVRGLTISRYPVQTVVPEARDCRMPDPGPPGDTRTVICDSDKLWIHKPRLSFEFDADTPTVEWRVKVGSAQTGVPDGNNAPANAPDRAPVQKKWITITKPDGSVLRNRVLLTSLSQCGTTHPVTGACNEPWVRTDQYAHVEHTAISEYGIWRSLIEIEDAAGEVKKLWWNFTVHDADPIISLLEPVTALDAGTAFLLRVEVRDEHAPAVTWANWTHTATKAVFNRTLTPTACPGSNIVCRQHEKSFSTGLGGNLTLAGAWKLTVAVKEGGGAGRVLTATHDLTIRDPTPPTILTAVASAAEEEAGFPVIWNVTATDATNWTAFLTVLKEDDSVLDGWTAVPMGTRVGSSSEYRSSALPIGRYRWFVRVEDSLGQATTSQRTFLEILSNTAPRVTLTAPSLPTGTADTYWTAVRPVVTALVYDNDGVQRSSLRILIGPVGGTLVDVTGSSWIRASTNPPGFLIQYNHTSSDPNDLELRIDVKDNSVPGNPKNATFTLKVDAVAPQSTLGTDGISQPKYRAHATHIWNVTSQTVFTITSLDPQGSGVARAEYRIDADGPWQSANPAGFTISAVPRQHTLYYRAYDKVGNVETEKFLRIWMDTEAPFFRTTEPWFEVDAKWTNFTILDVGSGVHSASAWYKINNAQYVELPLAYNETKLMWVGKLPNLTRLDQLRIYATAKDFMGNVGAWGSPSNPPANFTVGNRRPVISLLEPPGNSTVSGTVTIAWDITDPDGDPVTVTILYRGETSSEWRYAARNLTTAKGSYQFDTTTVLDGKYSFELSAFDGSYFARHLFSLSVLNAQPAISQVKLNDPKPEIGRGLVISAFVTKKEVEWVRANVTRDGQRVASDVALNDQGRDGDLVAGDRLYAGTWVPDAPGSYNVEIVVKYREGGSTHQYAKSAKFSVQATSSWVVQDNPVLIAAIAAFGLGVVGLAAWGLTRRWA